MSEQTAAEQGTSPAQERPALLIPEKTTDTAVEQEERVLASLFTGPSKLQ